VQTFKRIEVVANCASGSVGRGAPAHVAEILKALGLEATVRTPEPDDLMAALRSAVDSAPDLLVVLAGDGTARAAAQLCGPDGPVIAPLPGGTMNMLPHAIYGQRPWPDALTLALTEGVVQPLGGGEVDGLSFMVAAILGPPALWAPAREAARFGRGRQALRSARVAMGRAFTGRLRYILDGGPREKTEALVFLCPLTSRALAEDDAALEVAALDMKSAVDVLRLGFHAFTGDWRADPNVTVDRCRLARVWSAHGVPATLDGESVRLKSLSDIRYTPKIARVLALPKADA
jgi:diacylglycerol kinase family enzyme